MSTQVGHGTTWTPGPWKVGHSGFERRPCITARAMTGAPFTVANVTEEADARLIAAAHELYEALHGILNDADNDVHARHVKRGLAALRKARGETSEG